MNHQGAGWPRSATDARLQPPWPSQPDTDGSGAPERTGALPIRSPGTGTPQYGSPGGFGDTMPGGLASTGSGAQRVLGPGTGPQRLIGSGSGAQPTLGGFGAPARGFPRGREQPEPADTFGAWHAPRETLTGPVGGHVCDETRIDAFSLDDDTDPVGLAAPRDPADPGEQASPARRRRSGRNKRRSRVALLATAAVVAAAAGFAGYKYLYEPRVNAPVPSTLRLPTDAPGSPGFDQALGRWQHIGTRAEDPQPLTIAGLYPPQFVFDGKSYVRTAASVTKTCSLAVYGADLQASLQTGHCTQVVRASYMSGDGTMMGTVGVASLVSSSAAGKAGKATGPQEIIAPLSAKKGATSKLGNGTGVVQAEIKGHYLILLWAEYTNLKSPSGAAQRQALEQFATNLVAGSANINLSIRMLSGKG